MNIYVGNLSTDVSEEDLQNAFEAFGKVKSASLIKDRDSGRSKGFGFVEMDSRDEGQAAIEGLNGTELEGKENINSCHYNNRNITYYKSFSCLGITLNLLC